MNEKIDLKLNCLKNKRLLVTGGHGFLGRWVIETALQHGALVTSIDRKPHLAHELPVDVIHMDILSCTKLDSLIEKTNCVIHLAGSLGTEKTFSNLFSTIENNILVTAKILQSCLEKNCRAVFLTVGNNWSNPYTITKHCAADLGLMANLECGGDFRILKIMNAYGPWQVLSSTKKIIPTFFHKCLLNKPIPVYGDGNQCIDLIFAKDVALAILLACVENDFPNDKYLEVGTFIPHRVSEVADIVCNLTNSTSKIVIKGKRQGEPIHSITLAKDDSFKIATGFVTQVTLEDGLKASLEWYSKNPSYLDVNPNS